MEKKLPFTAEQIEKIIQQFPTPFYIYDERGIRESAQKLIKAFAWAPGFKEYFAVKALPNPHILTILKEEGLGADCSSLSELVLTEQVGMTGEEIMFTANDTAADEFQKAKELEAIINLDDITHIDYLEKSTGLTDIACFRYNPGSARVGNSIIGKPEEAKFGMTKAQLFEAYKIMENKGIKRFGLHTMLISNELEPRYFIETAEMIFDLVVEISQKLNISFEFVNLGGGIGIPYRPEQKEMDLDALSIGIKQAYQSKIINQHLQPLKIFMECGRVITGPHGYLISKVLHLKDTYKKYIGLDASMANLMRPAMYGSYHHITVLNKESGPCDHLYDVTGSLCENNDKFAIDRYLPEVEVGDIVIIHDTGAHGHSMGFNYNGKLRSAELLLKADGTVQQIRRAETLDDYFATLSF